MMMRRWLVLGLLVSAMNLSSLSAQQANGQVCLRAFEDRDANGILDAGEPLITRDIGVNLSDTQGVIIQTALLDDSARAAQGIVCFQNLATGQYTLNVASAAYSATTSATLIIAVSANAVPQVLDFGAQIITTAPLVTEPVREVGFTEAQLERILWSSLGAVGVIFVLMLVGFFILLVFVRPKRQALAPSYPYGVPPTGQYPPYGVPPAGQYPPYGVPPTGQYPPYGVPPTGQQPAVTPYPPTSPYAPPYTPSPSQAVPPSPYAPPPADDDTGRHRAQS
jgi:hypothetical protein